MVQWDFSFIFFFVYCFGLVNNPSNAERLLISKVQGRKYFWKTSEPYHAGIQWIAFAEYSQMSTHLPGFQSFFKINFFRIFVLAKIATSSISVELTYLSSKGFLLFLPPSSVWWWPHRRCTGWWTRAVVFKAYSVELDLVLWEPLRSHSPLVLYRLNNRLSIVIPALQDWEYGTQLNTVLYCSIFTQTLQTENIQRTI